MKVEAVRVSASLGYVGSVVASSDVELLSRAWRKAEELGTGLYVSLLLSGGVDLNLLNSVRGTLSEAEKAAYEHGVRLTCPSHHIQG